MEESESKKTSSATTPEAAPLDSKSLTDQDYISVHLSEQLKLRDEDAAYDDDDDDDYDGGDSYSSEYSDDSSSGDSDDSDLSIMYGLGLRLGSPYDAYEYEESFNRTQANSDAEEAPEELAAAATGDAHEAHEAMQLSSLLRSHLRKINSRNSSPMHDYLAPVAKVPSISDSEVPAKTHVRQKRKQRRAHAAFEKGALKTRVECRICLTPIRQLHARLCCSFDACNRCMKSYVDEKVRSGCVHVECPNDKCTKLMHRDEIMARLSGRQLRDKFQQFLVDANNEVNRKTCPRCSHVKTFDLQLFKSSKTRPRQVTCDKCELQWCFACHAPWHEGLKCAKFQKGDVFLKKWAKEECKGQKNAQRCPKCKVYIQRSKGCDHMTCSQCKAEFCYKCGEQFRKLLFIGDHHSKYSVLGCKYRLLPGKSVKRKMIRGSILGGKLLVAPVVGSLALVAGVVVLGLGCIALPVYGTYRLAKFAKKRKCRERNPTPVAINVETNTELQFPSRFQTKMPLSRTWRRSDMVEMPIKELVLEESPKWSEQGDLNLSCKNKRDSISSLNTERTLALSTSLCTELSVSNLRV